MYKIEYNPEPVPYNHYACTVGGSAIREGQEPEEVEASYIEFDAGFVVLRQGGVPVKVVPNNRVKSITQVK